MAAVLGLDATRSTPLSPRADGGSMEAVLSDWIRSVESEFDALTLFDLPFRSSIHRVFLFPGSFRVDLSFTPGPELGAYGPRVALLFGTGAASARRAPAITTAGHAAEPG